MMQRRGLLRGTSPEHRSPLERMLNDAAQVHRAGTDWSEILLLADRNSHVNQLNQRVREIRMAHGELDESAEKVIQVSNDRGYSRQLALCPGDRIMLRKNAKLGQTPVFNGDRATVTHIECHESGNDEAQFKTLVYVRLDRSGTEICWHLSDYDKLDHAYAMTVHKSQGLTVEHAFYLVSETTDRRSAYVAFTRAKTACPFYLSPECESAFANRTNLFKAKMTALDADPETKRRTLQTPIRTDDTTIRAQQPKIKELLEKSGVYFSYTGTPEILRSAAPDALAKQIRSRPAYRLQTRSRAKLDLLLQRLRERLSTFKLAGKTILKSRFFPEKPESLGEADAQTRLHSRETQGCILRYNLQPGSQRSAHDASVPGY